jgi:hypothetical protein
MGPMGGWGSFANTLFTNELADSPRSRAVTGGDSYSSVSTPTVFQYADLPEVV